MTEDDDHESIYKKSQMKEKTEGDGRENRYQTRTKLKKEVKKESHDNTNERRRRRRRRRNIVGGERKRERDLP